MVKLLLSQFSSKTWTTCEINSFHTCMMLKHGVVDFGGGPSEWALQTFDVCTDTHLVQEGERATEKMSKHSNY